MSTPPVSSVAPVVGVVAPTPPAATTTEAAPTSTTTVPTTQPEAPVANVQASVSLAATNSLGVSSTASSTPVIQAWFQTACADLTPRALQPKSGEQAAFASSSVHRVGGSAARAVFGRAAALWDNGTVRPFASSSVFLGLIMPIDYHIRVSSWSECWHHKPAEQGRQVRVRVDEVCRCHLLPSQRNRITRSPHSNHLRPICWELVGAG